MKHSNKKTELEQDLNETTQRLSTSDKENVSGGTRIPSYVLSCPAWPGCLYVSMTSNPDKDMMNHLKDAHGYAQVHTDGSTNPYSHTCSLCGQITLHNPLYRDEHSNICPKLR